MNIDDHTLPELFEHERARFTKDFLQFNLYSSYRFNARCHQNMDGTICYDFFYKNMPHDQCLTNHEGSKCG